jgi:hypothetical protein
MIRQFRLHSSALFCTHLIFIYFQLSPFLTRSSEEQLLDALKNYFLPRRIAGSSPDDFTGVLNLPDPSSRAMALGSTQPLTEMGTRNFPMG